MRNKREMHYNLNHCSEPALLPCKNIACSYIFTKPLLTFLYNFSYKKAITSDILLNPGIGLYCGFSKCANINTAIEYFGIKVLKVIAEMIS